MSSPVLPPPSASRCSRAASSPSPTAPARRSSQWSTARWRSASGPAAPPSGRSSRSRFSGGDRTVIGVVDDVRYYGLAAPARPLAQRFFPAGVPPRPLVRRCGRHHPAARAGGARRPRSGAPLSGVSTLRARVDEALARWQAPALLAGLLALVTLVLTMGGLYAVLTMAVGPADARAGDSGGPRRPRGLVALDGARRGAPAGSGGSADRSRRRGAAVAAAGEPASTASPPRTPRHWRPA